MQNVTRKWDEWDVPAGTYTVESIYPTRKVLSLQTVQVKGGRVYPERESYSLSIGDFFHDHKIVKKH